MSECCREKTLIEYIRELEIDENLKKRMLDMCEEAKKIMDRQDGYLRNCHLRIGQLEQCVVELGTELAQAKRFIREKGW